MSARALRIFVCAQFAVPKYLFIAACGPLDARGVPSDPDVPAAPGSADDRAHVSAMTACLLPPAHRRRMRTLRLSVRLCIARPEYTLPPLFVLAIAKRHVRLARAAAPPARGVSLALVICGGSGAPAVGEPEEEPAPRARAEPGFDAIAADAERGGSRDPAADGREA